MNKSIKMFLLTILIVYKNSLNSGRKNKRMRLLNHLILNSIIKIKSSIIKPINTKIYNIQKQNIKKDRKTFHNKINIIMLIKLNKYK